MIQWFLLMRHDSISLKYPKNIASKKVEKTHWMGIWEKVCNFLFHTFGVCIYHKSVSLRLNPGPFTGGRLEQRARTYTDWQNWAIGNTLIDISLK